LYICSHHAQKRLDVQFPRICAEFFKLPSHLEPIALIPVGYPDEQVIPHKKRKEASEIIHWNKF
jgi:nitroreductase